MFSLYALDSSAKADAILQQSQFGDEFFEMFAVCSYGLSIHIRKSARMRMKNNNEVLQ